MSNALIDKTLGFIKEHNIKFTDWRFSDTRGREHHVSVPSDILDENFLSSGKMFDGSSIAGWKSINESDMILKPDLNTLLIDPFYDEPTLLIKCDIIEPSTLQTYNRDPRGVARRAEEYLRSTGIADTCLIGPEPECFIFDDVKYKVTMSEVFFKLDSAEAAWNSATPYDGGNIGHRPAVKGGYFPVPPVDSLQDLRSAMSLTLKEMGLLSKPIIMK